MVYMCLVWRGLVEFSINGLHQIQEGVFQRRRRSLYNEELHNVLVAYLWMQLPGGTNVLRKLGLIHTVQARLQLRQLLEAKTLTRRDRLVLQISASYMSARSALRVVENEGTLRANLNEWEYLECLANAMSNESTVAPATFVDVVIGEQQRRRFRTHLDTLDLYVVFLENLGFLCKHVQKGPSDSGALRQAYKYAGRACSAHSRMLGPNDRGSRLLEAVGLRPGIETVLLRLPPGEINASTLKSIHQSLTVLFEALLVEALQYGETKTFFLFTANDRSRIQRWGYTSLPEKPVPITGKPCQQPRVRYGPCIATLQLTE
jgi:hypothetical protein